MVAIKDFGMPSCCMNCGLLGKEEMYCSIYPRKDLDIITVATNRPNWCPLVEREERKVGKWILSRPDIYTCSICGLDAPTGEVNHQGYVYCPKCGNRVER